MLTPSGTRGRKDSVELRKVVGKLFTDGKRRTLLRDFDQGTTLLRGSNTPVREDRRWRENGGPLCTSFIFTTGPT